MTPDDLDVLRRRVKRQGYLDCRDGNLILDEVERLREVAEAVIREREALQEQLLSALEATP